MDCRRRLEGWGAKEYGQGKDSWIRGRCSFCGSLDPETVLERIAQGESICPTDKSYKLYLGNDKFYFQHFSIDQQERFIDLYNAKTVVIETPGYFYVLPFFMTYTPEKLDKSE